MDGNYEFLDQPQGFDFTLTPDKDGDHRNGVSTIDLVMIQRHIWEWNHCLLLYKMIAADANNDGKISVSDLSELRKLILVLTPNFQIIHAIDFQLRIRL